MLLALNLFSFFFFAKQKYDICVLQVPGGLRCSNVDCHDKVDKVDKVL